MLLWSLPTALPQAEFFVASKAVAVKSSANSFDFDVVVVSIRSEDIPGESRCVFGLVGKLIFVEMFLLPNVECVNGFAFREDEITIADDGCFL